MPGRGLQHLPLQRIPEQWDPKWFADFCREVLALADTRNAIEGAGITISGTPGQPATIAASDDVQNLLLQRFVLTAPSGFLDHDRVLAGEAGVVDITDGGDNGNVTVSLAVNGVALSKLVIQTTFGVLGNRYPANSNVQLISPSSAGMALVYDGSLLDWTLTPTWLGSHQWGDGLQLILGTGADATIEHDGTDFHFQNITGDAVWVTAGDFNIAGLTFTVATDGVDQLQIDADGAWNVQGDPGTAGDVLTSSGPGAPPVWAVPAGGGGGGLTLIGHVVASGAVADLSVTSIPGSYSHLLIVYNGRGDAAGVTNVDVRLQFNGDTGANYNYQQDHFVSSATSFSEGISTTYIVFENGTPGATATANRASVAQGMVPNYAATVFDKVLTATAFSSLSDGGFTNIADLNGGTWKNTAAITSIRIFPASGNFVTGSGLWVYGIP